MQVRTTIKLILILPRNKFVFLTKVLLFNLHSICINKMVSHTEINGEPLSFKQDGCNRMGSNSYQARLVELRVY